MGAATQPAKKSSKADSLNARYVKMPNTNQSTQKRDSLIKPTAVNYKKQEKMKSVLQGSTNRSDLKR